MKRTYTRRQPNVVHDSPKNGSDAINPEEFTAKIQNFTPEENPGLVHERAPLLDPKMVHPDFQVAYSLDAEKMKKLEALAFNEQIVTVDILDTDDEDADVSFHIEVCGEKQGFYRGGRFSVKRKFVEGLARARPVSFSPRKNAAGEITGAEYTGRRGEKYPFQVYHDPHPNGREWLRQIRSQP